MPRWPKPTRPFNLQRIARCGMLSAAATGIVLGVAALGSDLPLVQQLSLGTAYAGLVFLALVLTIGPLNLLRQRPNPVSSHFRRDAGICTGILALVHTVLGLQVHFGGDFVRYFIFPNSHERLLPLRYDAFGVANYTGLVATLVFLVLLGLSNNASLRRLGVQKWKSLQRWAYPGSAFVVVHGALYQMLERRDVAMVVALVLISGSAVLAQGFGIREGWRSSSRQARQEVPSAYRSSRSKNCS
jgi:methionine sulfoxide reductase heme-binding subunit